MNHEQLATPSEYKHQFVKDDEGRLHGTQQQKQTEPSKGLAGQYFELYAFSVVRAGSGQRQSNGATDGSGACSRAQYSS